MITHSQIQYSTFIYTNNFLQFGNLINNINIFNILKFTWHIYNTQNFYIRIENIAILLNNNGLYHNHCSQSHRLKIFKRT